MRPWDGAVRAAKKIISAYRKGATTREVGAALGLDESTVRRALRANGVERRRLGPRGRTDVQTELLVQLCEEGLTWQEIADEVQMSTSGVRRRYLTWVLGHDPWRPQV